MTLVEVPIKSSAEIGKGMILVYDALPEKRWLICGNHRSFYTIECNGAKITASNERRNKIMMSDFDSPNSAPFLGCFNIYPRAEWGNYKVYRQQ